MTGEAAATILMASAETNTFVVYRDKDRDVLMFAMRSEFNTHIYEVFLSCVLGVTMQAYMLECAQGGVEHINGQGVASRDTVPGWQVQRDRPGIYGVNIIGTLRACVLHSIMECSCFVVFIYLFSKLISR